MCAMPTSVGERKIDRDVLSIANALLSGSGSVNECASDAALGCGCVESSQFVFSLHMYVRK